MGVAVLICMVMRFCEHLAKASFSCAVLMSALMLQMQRSLDSGPISFCFPLFLDVLTGSESLLVGAGGQALAAGCAGGAFAGAVDGSNDWALCCWLNMNISCSH